MDLFCFVLFIVHIIFTPLVCGAQRAPQGSIVAYMALNYYNI